MHLRLNDGPQDRQDAVPDTRHERRDRVGKAEGTAYCRLRLGGCPSGSLWSAGGLRVGMM